MRERALPVATNDSHDGFGRAVGDGEDLDVVAVLELGAQRHQLVVDPRGDAVVADVGVHARSAKSTAVAPRGSAMILPFGVNT